MGSGNEGGNAEAPRGKRVGDHLGSGIFQSRLAYLVNSVSLPRCGFPRQIYTAQSSPRVTLTGPRDAVNVPL